jgi:hypothetical protein
MSNLQLFHPVERKPVMETIMKPLSYVRRQARWLMAAGLALASGTPAAAQLTVADPVEPRIQLERPDRPEREPGELRPFFEKIGKQRNCDYVTYRLRFGFRGDPEAFANPAIADLLKNYRMDLTDEMPNGLTVINVQASGDGTDAGGGPLPPGTIGTTADPNDTARLDDFRLSFSDLDGSGEVGQRYVEVRITAKIDPAAFPAPALVDNQGFVRIQRPVGADIYIPSHDPALPDDGDFLTGAKTSIRIDVTDCEPPPPPPPGEACFSIEEGEVDCVPGGGAFIYHMPVGPELGGKVVQLKTTTPGVTVAPISQIAPIGGGVLDWTITGAMPGDVVHLVVVGVETYVGPEEGVGLCCSQEIDLVIPEDIKCPPKDREPDLKIDKRADVATCTRDGGCAFTITVTNVGAGPYNGKIVLDEVTLPGDATIDSGPNVPWVCAPLTSPMQCEHPATTLNPGESVDLKIGFKPGPAWDARYIRNCARYNYGASGKPLFGLQTNDRACATIPLCVPGRDRECTPIEKKVDLTIRKSALRPVCSIDGVCHFRIDIVNSGTVAVNGPLSVVDTYPAGVPASSDFEPTPPWACGPTGPGQFQCNHPGLVLVPGASTPIFVRAIVGPDFRPDQLENCAEVLPVPGESNLANNKSCAKVRVPQRDPGKPVINVEKTGDSQCRAGQPCTFEITIRNDGDAPFNGPVQIGDAVELEGLGRLDGVPVTSIVPPFGCSPEPATLPISCDANLSLGAGESRVHQVTIVIPEDAVANTRGPIEGRNCVAVLEPGTPVQGGGQGGAPLAGGKSDARAACHPFTLVKDEVKPECSAGFVLNAAGRCVCPEGTRFRNGQCTEIGTPVPVPPPVRKPDPEPQQCTLLPGQIRTESGRCICPRGTELRGQRCVKSTPEQCKLLPGQIRTEAGRCICPRGTELRNQRCVKPTPPQCKLLPGQIRTQDGRCICPRGTSLVRGECRQRQVECPRGTRLVQGRCVGQIDPVCRRGQVLRGGKCIDVAKPRCPVGTRGTPPNCRPIFVPQLQLERKPNEPKTPRRDQQPNRTIKLQ